MMNEASSRRTCQRRLWGWQGSKEQGLRLRGQVSRRIHSKKPGVKYRPKVTQNGPSERGHTPDALSLAEEGTSRKLKGAG